MEEKKDKYNDWIKKIHDASEIKSEEEKEIVKEEKVASKEIQKSSKKVFILPLIIFFLALFPRLIFLFTNDPQSAGLGWYGDVYHHWQVAYLSKEVGFTQGFLRLWDFKGMEYYWGLMHPLVLSTLFAITGSVDILIPRLLSVFGGSLIAVFVYLLVKRYFNLLTAVFAGIWVAFFPVVLFSDTLGMQEQLGLVFLLGGILIWPRYGILTGILWAFAAMVRSEFWIFSLALVIAAFFDKRHKTGDKRILLFIGYVIPIALYMKYMLDYTGNPIFPIWWNYLASVVGEWFTNVDEPLDLVQTQAQWIGRAIFLFGATGFIISFIKRPRYYLFFLLGFANIAFIGFIFGFAAYVHGFFDRFWVDRLLAFPYLFSGTLVAIVLMYLLPKLAKNHKFLQATGVFLFLIILVLTQFSWIHIFKYFKIAQGSYPAEVKLAAVIAKYDMDGKILFPSDRPALTYALVRNHNVSGKKLISQMYDPFFYASSGDDPDEIDKKIFDWFEKEDIRLLVIGKAEYKDFIERYSDQFKELETAYGATLYEFLR